jgi:HEAT repeat protein
MAERTTRLVGLAALGALGQRRGRATLEAAAEDTEPQVREAAVRALIDIGATGVASRVRKLIEDESTKEAGIALALRVSSPEVTGALAARLRVSSDASLRRDAVVALGKQEETSAVPVLAALLLDPALQGDAAEALARSPSETWGAIVDALSKPTERRLGARMAALRARTLGDLPARVREALKALARSADPNDRAVAVAALILAGERGPRAALLDSDPRVRRAAVLSVDIEDGDAMAELSRHFASEKDPLVRRLMAGRIGATSRLPETVRELGDHVRDGDPLGPIAALSLARSAEDAERANVAGLLHSFDPLIRAHAARGLGDSHEPWALGLLADAYENEVDVGARRAVTLALAARTQDVDAPLRAHELRRASLFDPEESIRTIAERALRGLPPPEMPEGHDAVWLRVMTGTGAPTGLPTEALLVRPDGLALPIALDEDGYALVPAPRGPSRLVLAPRLHSYEGVPHGE